MRGVGLRWYCFIMTILLEFMIDAIESFSLLGFEAL